MKQRQLGQNGPHVSVVGYGAMSFTDFYGLDILPIPGTRQVAHLRELAKGGSQDLSKEDLKRIEKVLPVGWAHGDRYSSEQWIGPER